MRLKGIEPLAHSLEGCCSIQLSYRRKSLSVFKIGNWKVKISNFQAQCKIYNLQFPISNFQFFILVGARGFEPPTFCSQSRRATGLRHAPLYNHTVYTPTGRPYNTHTPPHCQALCPDMSGQDRRKQTSRRRPKNKASVCVLNVCIMSSGSLPAIPQQIYSSCVTL